ncbi:MAG: restriction endonuclease [Phycisphaerales bacterium]|nr:MAG: restriction endonuclease [Phycisphaerales bacterium]
MSFPTYEDLMLPLLRLASDGKEHQIGEATDLLGEQLSLSKEQLAALLPSGKAKKFRNRVNWASVYLRKSGLLESTRRGWIRITPRGREVLAENPPRVDRDLLSRFPEYHEFKAAGRNNQERTGDSNSGDRDDSATPDEQLESAFAELRESLVAEILEQLKVVDPQQFERIVLDVLVAMGYGGRYIDAAQQTGKSHDGGIDGVINEDRLGLDTIYVQAKRWTNGTVGRKEIQSFVGSIEGRRAHKGVFITTSTFADTAREYVSQIGKRIVLIDGQLLASYMVDFGVGVSTVKTLEIKRLDSDYFEES